jgi:hypothetical protein
VRAPRWPNTRPRAIDREPSHAYDRAVANLRPERLRALKDAEDDILDDPGHMKNRRRRNDGSIVDMNGDLIVTYRVVGDRVLFLDVDDPST